MTTRFRFKDAEVEYDSSHRVVWNGVSPWTNLHINSRVKNQSTYFSATIIHKDFEVVLYMIYWEDLGYEINPYVSRGSDNLKTLHHRVRLTAEKITLNDEELFVAQFRIAKIKSAIPPVKIHRYRQRSKFWGQPKHSNLFNTNIKELDKICQLNTTQYLIEECNAVQIDKKYLITGDAGQKKNAEFVSFRRDNFKLMIVLFIMTRIQPMLKEIIAE